ncbi:MAG: molecular chaperone TorD family protein [Lachnospiraceae bacterium]|nr:molecular chaperone TorD family protein [Lachnospiraceae bacterium]
MHHYTAKSELFYADLSDLLLLTSIGLTNPDRELAAGLTDGGYIQDMKACLDGLYSDLKSLSMSRDLEDILTVCTATSMEEDPEALYTRINREYNRLFTNPRRELVPIYESILVHPDEKKATMFINATCMHAEQTYRHNNFTFEEKNKIPGDHVAIELRYLAYLFASYLNAVHADNNTSCEAVEAAVADFCGAHVVRWLNKLASQIKANTEDPFYLLLAEVLMALEDILLK